MTLSAQTRIANERLHPRVVDLWFALQPLKTTARFMNTGAHPDDETTAMLAALAFRDGLNLSYACANRGEGGQNDIGTEMTDALGALRTREMERACDVLAMRMYWLSEHPDDSIFDFGFSKSGVETLAKWGKERTLARFVEIVRTEQPDILCPTFLDIPGQHGHHRAMTETALDVIAAAENPDFPDSDLPVWSVSKLYLPAWSGAGQSYDDDLPPPPATLVVKGTGRDPVTGWSYAHIAQHSRAFHKTQGMGRWIAPGDAQDWPLHLAVSWSAAPDYVEEAVTDGVCGRLDDWAQRCSGGAVLALRDAQKSLDDATTSFPDYDAITKHCAAALKSIRQVLDIDNSELPSGLTSRLDQKKQQIGRVMALAAGVELHALSSRDTVRAMESTQFLIEKVKGDAEQIETEWVLPPEWSGDGTSFTPAKDAALHDGYRATYDLLHPAAPALRAKVTHHGTTFEIRRALTPSPIVLPPLSVEVEPLGTVLNTTMESRSLSCRLSNIHPAAARPSLALPEDWSARMNDSGATITLPEKVSEGLYTLPVHLDDKSAQTVRPIAYSHIEPTALIKPAQIAVRLVEARLDDARIGYIGAGKDRVGHWLAAIGADVSEVTDAELTSKTALDAYDTLVVGIFAFRFRAGLAMVAPRLHAWVERGGNLVTLYHRPWDNWDPDMIPPRPLEIGQPSLRWRVTDENADVSHLHPDHPLLTWPNRIGPADWHGWHKERGLYFAKSWDQAYTPLLEMADPDEAPHQGALLSARIGRGQHTHTSLILHHQMEKLTSGAFRIMANLVAKPR